MESQKEDGVEGGDRLVLKDLLPFAFIITRCISDRPEVEPFQHDREEYFTFMLTNWREKFRNDPMKMPNKKKEKKIEKEMFTDE